MTRRPVARHQTTRRPARAAVAVATPLALLVGMVAAAPHGVRRRALYFSEYVEGTSNNKAGARRYELVAPVPRMDLSG